MIKLPPVIHPMRMKIISGFVLSQVSVFMSALPALASGGPDPTDPNYYQSLLAWRVYELTVMARNIMTWIRTTSPTLWIAFCASFAFVAVRFIRKFKKT